MNKPIMFYILFTMTIFAAVIYAADRRCVMRIDTCPEIFNNQTISIPDNVVGIAPSVRVCKDSAYFLGIGTNNISIFFIIDNSGSMSGGENATDSTCARFAVTKALIDTIFKKQPTAQVGLALFQDYLFFDTSTSKRFWYSTYFKTMSKVYDKKPSQAYMPLLTLNQLYNGIRGIDILDSALEITGSGKNIALRYTPNFPLEGRTNINIGFLAAREAFASATAAKENQYIVFLSDGDANRGEWDPGLNGIYYFRDNTINVPTTFTVFFNSQGSTAVPDNIKTMTRNIQKNGYSLSNQSSANFAITASYSALSDILMSNVISRINVQGVPIRMVINNVTSSTLTNGGFVYPDTIRFDTPDTNRYTMQIVYRYTNPSTGQTQDSAETIKFLVRRDPNASVPKGITVACTTFVPPIISTISTAPANNPVGTKKIAGTTQSFYQNVLQNSGSSGSAVNGALIGIRSKGAALAQRTSGSGNNVSYGDAVVYDAAGNLVSKNLHVYYAAKNIADSTFSYGVYWNCHNLNGRWVGNGTYLFVISTTDVSNKTEITRIKVGVSR